MTVQGRTGEDEASAPVATPSKHNSPSNKALSEDDGLYWSGRFAGGIRNDIKRRWPWYTSDWVDGLRGGIKTFTAALYMFFGCLAPGIAFGAYFDQHSGGKSGVVEYLITQGVSGVIFAIFSGQPLVILRPTGPITVFISQLYKICESMSLSYHSVQAWVGIFVGTYMIIIAVTDCCAAIRHCSRFTQDMFGFFVSVIFVSLGIGNIVDKFTVKHEEYNAPVQLIMTVAMLYTAFTLAGFNKTRFFNSKVRDTVADFAVALAVITFTIVANLLTVPIEPLPVPPKFEPTETTRSWLVDLGCPTCALIGAVGAVPLVLLFFIDQNVTMLLTQHPDHNLKKGAAFHYNFLLLGIFNICFPLFGCPYVTGSLPHSPQFVNALARKEVVREGGFEKTRVVEVYENRVAPLLVNVLILVCLPVIGSLKSIPTAVICDALFLYMGLSGLPGNELFERIKLAFTEEALYPSLHFTKDEVPRKQMHVFTLLQLCVVAVLFGVTRSPIAMAFPVFIVLSIPFRMNLHRLTLGFITQDHVLILDHRQPSTQKSASGANVQDAEALDIEGAEAAESEKAPVCAI
mmetsp:Transcript_95180/g.268973  ORF Transcript_95180/g.268973 Transcript_95180/m.268973 type:complete len:573 (+) Transcript_95180:82-1800(+)|eukprot:CAMPEP_0117495192 /NCGR_PEP_ID=MMETSP0784-20121206/20005_1 /TAXON_ID=39447 /ORGANISM="" /LENGTH=572 /DNA_ID=CAMNT_0005290105 /DNA_START=80 /DNA_END=1798 /DNA_ORIENTATION=+